jgi:antitoxin component of RelBE/YafQ-DinJ toxin-antitoxin module
MKMVTVQIEEEAAREFKARVELAGLDMSKVVRRWVADYLKKDSDAIALDARALRRAELHAYIIGRLREVAASRRNDSTYVELLERGLGLKPGTLYALLQD